MKKLTAPVLLVGTTANTPDIRYATGFTAPDTAVVVHQSDRTILVVSSMEFGRARRQAAHCTVECPDSLGLPPKHHADPAEWTLAALSKHGVRAVSVDPAFPVGVARRLEAGNIVLTISGDSSLKRSRIIKNDSELRAIARAQRAARAGMKAAGQAITSAEVGRNRVLRLHGRTLTSEVVRTLIRRTVIEFGCMDEDTIVAGGGAAADPHDAGSGPLRSGEWIVCDIFPRSLETGYWGDMTRTFMNGRPSPEQKRLYRAVKAAHDAALARIAPGITGAAVHAAAAETLNRAGFETGVGADGIPHGFIHSTGHGVGLEIHEPPRLSPSGGILRENMVVTVEPGLYYPNLGGVRMEDLVVVRPEGARRM